MEHGTSWLLYLHVVLVGGRGGLVWGRAKQARSLKNVTFFGRKTLHWTLDTWSPGDLVARARGTVALRCALAWCVGGSLASPVHTCDLAFLLLLVGRRRGWALQHWAASGRTLFQLIVERLRRRVREVAGGTVSVAGFSVPRVRRAQQLRCACPNSTWSSGGAVFDVCGQRYCAPSRSGGRACAVCLICGAASSAAPRWWRRVLSWRRWAYQTEKHSAAASRKPLRAGRGRSRQ